MEKKTGRGGDVSEKNLILKGDKSYFFHRVSSRGGGDSRTGKTVKQKTRGMVHKKEDRQRI